MLIRGYILWTSASRVSWIVLGVFFAFFLIQSNLSRVTGFSQAGSTGGFPGQSRQAICVVYIPLSPFKIFNWFLPTITLAGCCVPAILGGLRVLLLLGKRYLLPSLTFIITTTNSRQRHHLSFWVWVEPNVVSLYSGISFHNNRAFCSALD